MDDAPAAAVPHDEEDFSSIYLRKITAELGDDLNTVREANDFTSRSLPMLIHALKQGESCYGVEERRRIVTAAKTS
jgi:ribosome assembly protein 3